jgi:hypothetical protein
VPPLQDKNSPLPPQDTQPLGELQNLPQGQPHDAGAAAAATGGNRWGAFADAAKPAQGGSQQQQDHEALMVRQQQHLALQQPDGFLLLSPGGAPSEVSMELTNDTLQVCAVCLCVCRPAGSWQQCCAPALTLLLP